VDENGLHRLLAAAVKVGASDVHLKAGAAPALRIDGELRPLRAPPLTGEDTERLRALVAASCAGRPDLDAHASLDVSYRVPGLGRFRVSLYRTHGAWALALRAIPATIPTFRSLGLPRSLRAIAGETRGLVLVTGVTGSGKSSTLAAMVDHINTTRRAHVLTIEDPIEFVHADKRSWITQREIGDDCAGFALELRAALRQDPDVILVGEMRDAETVETALEAAETGHLVFSTLHTTDAARTVGRIVHCVPPHARDGVRERLADHLRAIVSQRLVPRATGGGRVAAVEVLINTETVQTLIREGRTREIPGYLARNGDAYGTQTFDQHLLELHEAGVITFDSARIASSGPADLERAMQFEA